MQTTQPQNIDLQPASRAISWWLVLCVLLVAAMIVLGGVTRLTESGLSIVEWKPITGTLPPADNAAFEKEFDEYKTSPQYKKNFSGMTLEQFKGIYWLEYSHRLLGRVIGAVFFLPWLLFLLLKKFRNWQAFKLLCIFMLGGLQGVVGWYMVKSGLVDDPHVSPYRLALHLALGFTLLALLLWQFFTHNRPRVALAGAFELPKPSTWIRAFSCLVMLVIATQILVGALMAGLHAGLTYNTFPLMEGRWIPEGFWPSPLWQDNLQDIATIQFIHRAIAYSLMVIVPLFLLVGRKNPHIAHLLPILFSVLVVQFLLGVLTLLFVVPVPLASLHQANAILLFSIAVTILHRLFLPLRHISYGL